MRLPKSHDIEEVIIWMECPNFEVNVVGLFDTYNQILQAPTLENREFYRQKNGGAEVVLY